MKCSPYIVTYTSSQSYTEVGNDILYSPIFCRYKITGSLQKKTSIIMRMVKVSWRFFFYNNYLLHFLLIEGCSFIDCLQLAFILNNKITIIIIISLKIQSPLPKTDTFGTGTKCPS